QEWEPQQWVQKRPLQQAHTVFTDAGRKSKKAECVWNKGQNWREHLLQGQEEDSLQTSELKAVVWALSRWHDERLNVVSDSLYVVGVVQRVEDAVIRLPRREILGKLFF
ncbi:POK7 protein, partial [Dryoscopus gambensis]|nr:POK7 protein [Dryoscopus gambensis]